MLINADFSQRAALAFEDYHWVDSPQQGVERVMLDRVGAKRNSPKLLKCNLSAKIKVQKKLPVLLFSHCDVICNLWK